VIFKIDSFFTKKKEIKKIKTNVDETIEVHSPKLKRKRRKEKGNNK